jgi:Protein of unknown function (DUF732)
LSEGHERDSLGCRSIARWPYADLQPGEEMNITIAVLAVVSAALILAPAAAHADSGTFCSADPNMDCRRDPSGYLDTVHSAGITGNSDQTLVDVGDHICADLAHRTPTVVEARGIRQTNPSLTLRQGNIAVDMALQFLCPQLMRLDNQEPLILPIG